MGPLQVSEDVRACRVGLSGGLVGGCLFISDLYQLSFSISGLPSARLCDAAWGYKIQPPNFVLGQPSPEQSHRLSFQPHLRRRAGQAGAMSLISLIRKFEIRETC